VILLWLALASCSCRRTGPAAPVEDAPAVEQVQPAGLVVAGRFVDGRWGFSVPVPEGWVARPGRDDGSIRLTLVHEASGSWLEVWAFSGAADGFRPRSGCRWTFVDRARYRDRGGAEALSVGSCTPLQPDGALVQGWLIPGPGATAQVELHLPEGALAEGRRAAEPVLRDLRFEPGLAD